MASGKPIGEFSLKMVTQTNTPGPAGSVLVQVNFEGSGTGFGAIFDTSTFIGGGRDGTFSQVGSAYLDNGDVLSGVGQGTYESKGKHRWSTQSIIQISDGRRLSSTGEIDLAARTWKGTLSDIS
jgi:hypothetical protein